MPRSTVDRVLPRLGLGRLRPRRAGAAAERGGARCSESPVDAVVRARLRPGAMRIVLLAMLALVAGATASGQTPKAYPEPAVTTWAPQGCRTAPYIAPAIPSRRIWSNLHGNIANADEVSHALAPVFQEAWTVEAATFNLTGPVFDEAGNLYFAPFLPYENVVLISLDPTTGARRWAIAGTGAPPGASAPLVLRDPDDAGHEIVYLALKDRVLAVRADGSVVWDVPSGLTLGPDPFQDIVLGTNYLPGADAIAGLSKDGWLFAVDRRTGVPVLNAPFQLPGAPTPPGTPLAAPPAVVAAAEDSLQALADVPDGGLQGLISTLLGNASEVANMFAVDPWTDRLWVNATAPDAEDGTADGVSQLGALFRLELVARGAAHDVVEVCHRPFAGGSASTPTLDAAGARVYLGDNFGKLIAVNADCSDAWELDLGAQIIGSVSVPADRHEIYASTGTFVAKVIDEGASGRLEWKATIDPFAGLSGAQTNFNLDLVTAASNGLAFQGGAGIVMNGTPLPSAVGVGIIDRETGVVRSFAAGGEETVAVMSVGPDGAMYIGNSPVRRLFAHALNLSPAPIRGGITKFERARLDLLVRDAACAGQTRGRNASANALACPDSAFADAVQMRELAAEALGAVEDGGLIGVQAAKASKRLRKADVILAGAESGRPKALRRALRKATRALGRVCGRFAERAHGVIE